MNHMMETRSSPYSFYLNQVQVRFLKLGKAVDMGLKLFGTQHIEDYAAVLGVAVVVVADPESVTSLKMTTSKSKSGSGVVLHMSFNERPQHALA
ncbi:unnamed protein product [Cuscuta campestris]|uniref:Uncharacterized protein n=1 Tax=Cuscuta campestris TaxID=132261 RepID=A0A484KAZ5_9ASTE|nr:unnamed protein product [Cuscuta campestris]